MKRHEMLVVILVVFLIGAIAEAQQTTSSPQEELSQSKQRGIERSVNQYAQELQQVAQQLYQRGGAGGRGVPPGNPPLTVTGMNGIGVAWWTNPALVARLGLTDDQKAKIERAFENHRQSIVSSTGLLEKEEAQLARLLEAEPLDRNAVFTQIDRVVQARGEVERANSAMTLEMREYLTRAQWMQLQPSQRVRVGGNVIAANLISRVEPVYPESARQARIQGLVVLEAEISKEGIVETVKVISGDPMLTQAARDAVIQWRYKPTLLNGVPVAVVTTISVNFTFSGAGSGERGAAPAAPSPSVPGQRRGRGPQ